jgi:hypothetical protein
LKQLPGQIPLLLHLGFEFFSHLVLELVCRLAAGNSAHNLLQQTRDMSEKTAQLQPNVCFVATMLCKSRGAKALLKNTDC